jgi:hypothetical protein
MQAQSHFHLLMDESVHFCQKMKANSIFLPDATCQSASLTLPVLVQQSKCSQQWHSSSTRNTCAFLRVNGFYQFNANCLQTLFLQFEKA